jgi:pantoate--beta-alanine ligase
LSPEERRAATVLYRALTSARDLYLAGAREPEKLKNKARAMLQTEPGVTIDYVEIAYPETLAPLAEARGTMVMLLAARLGRTRLIDNLLIP